MEWRSWLRHCAANRKAVVSIPGCVNEIFHSYNPSGRTMALWLTQPLTEMSTRNIFWGVRRADNLTTFMCRLSRNMGTSTSWNSLGLSRPVMGLLYLLISSQLHNKSRSKNPVLSCVKLLTYFHEIRYEYLAAGSSF